MIKKFCELHPLYDSAKSFYGKAMIVFDENRVELFSYETKVAYIENGEVVVIGADSGSFGNDLYSATTLRHIKEFLRQHGFKANKAGEIRKTYVK